jgi:hypothetical protein
MALPRRLRSRILDQAHNAAGTLLSIVDRTTGQIGIDDLYGTTAVTSTEAGTLIDVVFHTVPGVFVRATV